MKSQNRNRKTGKSEKKMGKNEIGETKTGKSGKQKTKIENTKSRPKDEIGKQRKTKLESKRLSEYQKLKKRDIERERERDLPSSSGGCDDLLLQELARREKVGEREKERVREREKKRERYGYVLM